MMKHFILILSKSKKSSFVWKGILMIGHKFDIHKVPKYILSAFCTSYVYSIVLYFEIINDNGLIVYV